MAASFKVVGPTADLQNPIDGALISAGVLNSRGYIDVQFNAFGHTIDPTTITDVDDEFTIGGTFGGTLRLDPAQRPMVTSDPTIFRYWTIGTVTSGSPVLTFIPGSWGFTDTTTPAGAATPQVVANATTTTAQHYVDVRITPAFGETLVASTINGDELTLGGPGLGTAVLTGATPTNLPGTPIYRYFFTGAFGAGRVDIGFDHFSSCTIDSGTACNTTAPTHATTPETEHLTLQQLTADISNPTSGGAVGADVLNTRGYFDVTYTVPSYAASLDVASITDTTPEFTVSDPTVVLDSTIAPVLISHDAPSTYVFRYFYSGPKTGTPTINFIGGSFQYLDTAGKAIPDFQQQTFTTFTTSAQQVIDVNFGESSSVNVASIIDSDSSAPEITASGNYTLTRSSDTPVGTSVATFRYVVTHTDGTPMTAAEHVTITFNASTWTYGTTNAVIEASQTATLTDNSFIDVVYNGAAGVGLDQHSITGDEITLTGPGTGTGHHRAHRRGRDRDEFDRAVTPRRRHDRPLLPLRSLRPGQGHRDLRRRLLDGQRGQPGHRRHRQLPGDRSADFRRHRGEPEPEPRLLHRHLRPNAPAGVRLHG